MAWHHRAGVQDGWTEVPRLFSWDYFSLLMQEPTVVGDSCEDLAHGEKEICWENPKYLPQLKHLDVRDQGLV